MNNTITIEDEHELRYIARLFENTFSGDIILSEFRTKAADKNLESLIQPKVITYSNMPSDQTVMDVLTETIRCLQPYMTKKPEDCLVRKSNKFMVPIDFRNITGFRQSHREVEEIIEKLKKENFKFSWTQRAYTTTTGERIGEKRFTYSGILFIGYMYDSSYNYYLHINPMALPYLTFIGRGIGYTTFHYMDFLNMANRYCKRLYQLMCDWAGQGSEHTETLSELRTALSLPSSVTVTQLKKRYIEPIRKALQDSDGILKFDYMLKPSEDNPANQTKGRRSLDTVVFHFNAESKTTYAEENRRNTLRLCLNELADPEKKALTDELVDTIISTGKADFMLDKIRYYSHRRNNRFIDETKMKNILLKIVRESFGIDLRSSEHIRNAAKHRIRHS